VDHRLYQLRELTLTSGARLLVGIHFRGQSTSYPFVGVFAQSRWLTTEEMAAAHAALMREFRVFAPRASWWWAPTEEHVPKLATARGDLILVMGSLAEIRSQPTGALPQEWSLRRVSSVSEVAAAFLDLYQSFHDARPELAEAVPASPLDALEDCAKAEGLYACFVGAEIVGVVAAKPVAQYSVEAWLMWDLVLARQYCGKGLAPLLQRAVLDRLDSARAPLVVGTIHGQNLPSLRTALRVGRHVVGSWTFLTQGE
jgi:RimJ/RimL family protein N-acetyltransferase